MNAPMCPSCGKSLSVINLVVPNKTTHQRTTLAIDWDGYGDCWRTYLYKEEDPHGLVISCDECHVRLELEHESLDHYDGGDVLTLRPTSVLLMEALL